MVKLNATLNVFDIFTFFTQLSVRKFFFVFQFCNSKILFCNFHIFLHTIHLFFFLTLYRLLLKYDTLLFFLLILFISDIQPDIFLKCYFFFSSLRSFLSVTITFRFSYIYFLSFFLISPFFRSLFSTLSFSFFVSPLPLVLPHFIVCFFFLSFFSFQNFFLLSNFLSYASNLSLSFSSLFYFYLFFSLFIFCFSFLLFFHPLFRPSFYSPCAHFLTLPFIFSFLYVFLHNSPLFFLFLLDCSLKYLSALFIFVISAYFLLLQNFKFCHHIFTL